METSIQQWGNSLAVRLPKETARKLHLHRGSWVRITEKAGAVIVKPVQQKKEVTLEELVAGITKKNRHKLLDWGPPVGKEIL